MTANGRALLSASAGKQKSTPNKFAGNRAAKVVLFLGAVSKLGFWFKVKADVRFQLEEYLKYFED